MYEQFYSLGENIYIYIDVYNNFTIISPFDVIWSSQVYLNMLA